MKNFKLLTLSTALFLTFFSPYSVASDHESVSVAEVEAKSEAVASESSSSPSESSEVTEMKESEVADTSALESVPLIADIEYICRHELSVRAVKVFNNPPSGKACEVVYEKASGTKTLWTANMDKEFCARKAADFVQKQVGWGWDCTDKDGVAVTLPEPAPAEPEKPAAVDAIDKEDVENVEPEVSEASEETVETAPIAESTE